MTAVEGSGERWRARCTVCGAVFPPVADRATAVQAAVSHHRTHDPLEETE